MISGGQKPWARETEGNAWRPLWLGGTRRDRAGYCYVW